MKTSILKIAVAAGLAFGLNASVGISSANAYCWNRDCKAWCGWGWDGWLPSYVCRAF